VEEDQTVPSVEEFDQYRPLLFSIAYRMVGSVADAEDLLQETFLRWQKASGEEIRDPKAFLVTIVSRLSLNHLQSARVRREEYVGQWLPEPVITDPDSDPFAHMRIDESLSIAFLLLLERLKPLERAVFLLREVFDYEYSEIAEALGQSEANCRQVLHRARQHVAEVRPRFKATPEQHGELLQRFAQAVGDGDLDGLVALLSDDIVLHADGGGKAPAVPNTVHGADNVARAAIGGFRRLPQNLTRRAVQINGRPGMVAYQDGKPFSVITIDVRDGKISAVYIVSNPDKLTHLPSAPC
jgi:RNA polymerase sigma-70 factor, ECF subfamily